MKLAVLYGCNTANTSQTSAPVAYAPVAAGAGASLGFEDEVHLAGGPTTGPHYIWASHFWQQMLAGGTAQYAAEIARTRVAEAFLDDPMGTDKFRIFGNNQQRVLPAGYQYRYNVPLATRATSMTPLGGTWGTGLQLRNLSTTTAANVHVGFYWAHGTPNAGQLAATHNASIPANGTLGWHLPSGDIPTLPTGFLGSAVISADQPIAANANIETAATPVRKGSARGVALASTTLYFPQLHKHFWGYNSYLVVQNTSGTAASVTVRYYNASNGQEVSAATETFTLPAFTSAVRHQASNANLPSGWGGSAKVTVSGDRPLAGVASFYNAGTGAADAQLLHYNAFPAGATTVHVPRLVRNYYGYQSGLSIQNVGTAATTATIQYRFAGNTYTQYQTIQPGASVQLFLADQSVLNPVDSLPEYYRSGSAVVFAGQPLVAIANEDYRGEDAQFQGRGVTYTAFPSGTGGSALVFSQVTSRFYGYSGGVQVQNVGGSTTTVTAVFSAPGYADETRTASLAPGASCNWFAPMEFGHWDWNGSVVVTASQPLVGIANNSFRYDWDNRYPIVYGDSYVGYEGVPR